MNNLLTIINQALLLAIFLILTLGKGCNRHETGDINRTRDSLIVEHWDTARHEHKSYNFKTENHYHAPPSRAIDTAAVIKDYFTKKTVRDVWEDSLFDFTIIDSLYMNGIAYRYKSYKMKRPYLTEKIIRETETSYHTGLYGAAFAGFNGRSVISAGPELQYVTRRNSFGLGYDILNRGVTGRLGFRLNR